MGSWEVRHAAVKGAALNLPLRHFATRIGALPRFTVRQFTQPAVFLGVGGVNFEAQGAGLPAWVVA